MGQGSSSSNRSTPRCQRGSVADRKLLIDVMQVDFDGTLGKVEFTSDLFVRLPLAKQVQDLPFALSQRGRASRVFLRGAFASVRIPLGRHGFLPVISRGIAG